MQQKIANITLEQVKKDATKKGMEIIEVSAFPFQHLPGVTLKLNDITLYAWDFGEEGVLIERKL